MQEIISITVSDYLGFELVEKIAAAQWHRPDWRDRVIRMMYDYKSRSDCFNVIARSGGTVIGRIQCMRSVTNPRLWHYGDVFVAPEYRRRHIASQMLNAAFEVLCDRGCCAVRAYVGPENIPSLGLQKKFGFNEVPYEQFDDLLNKGELMFERDLQAYTIVPASEETALYICELCEQCAKSLHIGEIVYHDFYNEIVQMLNDTDEKNFLIYRGAFPCAWLKLNGFTDDAGWLSMLAVAPSFHRWGIGKFSVDFAERYLLEQGKKYIRIHTTEDNDPARMLYEKCGYALVDSRRNSERTTLTFEKALTNLRQ